MPLAASVRNRLAIDAARHAKRFAGAFLARQKRRPAASASRMMSPAMRWASVPCRRDRLDGEHRLDVNQASGAAATSGAGGAAAGDPSRHGLSGTTALVRRAPARTGRSTPAASVTLRDRADEMHAAVRQARPERQRDVDSGLRQFAVEGERVVEQEIAFRADAERRRKIGEIGGQRAQLLRPRLGRQLRRVEVPEPSHLRLREPEAPIAVEPVRGEIHLRRVGAVDRDEPGELAALHAFGRRRIARGREIGAGGIAGDKHGRPAASARSETSTATISLIAAG